MLSLKIYHRYGAYCTFVLMCHYDTDPGAL